VKVNMTLKMETGKSYGENECGGRDKQRLK
jgi:hypothetical protein